MINSKVLVLLRQQYDQIHRQHTLQALITVEHGADASPRSCLNEEVLQLSGNYLVSKYGAFTTKLSRKVNIQ